MKFKLLDNFTGVISERRVEKLREELEFVFENPPNNAIAVLENMGNLFYRDLVDGKCTIPSRTLEGIIQVRVSLLDGSTLPFSWKCESVEIIRMSPDTVIVAPNDTDMPEKIVELKIENQSLRAENNRLWAEIAGINKKIERLYEGYDIV